MTVAVRRGSQPRPEPHRQPREMIMEIPRSPEDSSDEDNSSSAVVDDEGRSRRVDEDEEETKEEDDAVVVVKPQRKKRVYLHRCPFKHGCSHNNNNKQVSHNNVSEASLNILRDYNIQPIRPDVTGRDFEEIDNNLCQPDHHGDDNRYLQFVKRMNSVEYVPHGKHDTKNNIGLPLLSPDSRLALIQRGLEGGGGGGGQMATSSSNPFFSSSHFLCATNHSSTCPRHIFFSSSSTSSSATPSPSTYNSPTVGVNPPHSSYIKRISDTANVFASLGLSVTKEFSLPPPPPPPTLPPSCLFPSTPSSPSPPPPPSSKHHTNQEKHEESSSSSSDLTHLLVSSSLQEQTDVIASTFRQSCKKFFLETLCPGATESDIQQVVSAVNSLEDRVYLCHSHSKMDYCYQLATKLCCIQEELQRISKVNHPGDAATLEERPEDGGGDPS